jgi:hypothetical protein
MTMLSLRTFATSAQPVAPGWGILAWVAAAYHAGVAGVVSCLHSVSQHTGIPVVVVAAAALVLSYRFARRGARLALEMVVALGLVLLATRLGWIHW